MTMPSLGNIFRFVNSLNKRACFVYLKRIRKKKMRLRSLGLIL